jgi:phenylacetate-CoA ligase
VFGSVSLYGANVYCENIMVGLEQPCFYGKITGKFKLNTTNDLVEKRLLLRVEMCPQIAKSTSLNSMIVESFEEIKLLICLFRSS